MEIEHLKAHLMDKETELENISEENERLKSATNKREVNFGEMDEEMDVEEAARDTVREVLMNVVEVEKLIQTARKLELLCRELQRQNKMLMDECRRASTEEQNLVLDLSNKFQDAIKEVSTKLEEQKDECILQMKENEMLKLKLKQFADHFALSKQQHKQQLKQKSLELHIAELKIQQHEEKWIHE